MRSPKAIEPPHPQVRTAATAELTRDELASIRALMDAAFVADEHGGFDDYDWDHALGGIHFVREVAGRVVAHAAVVARELHVAGRSLRTGYVEAVATAPALQRAGHGTDVMRAVNAHIDANFELGALGTGSQPFYERLGWQIWRGPSSVRTRHGDEATPDEDGYIMVLLTRLSPPINLEQPISCEWRSGDVW